MSNPETVVTELSKAQIEAIEGFAQYLGEQIGTDSVDGHLQDYLRAQDTIRALVCHACGGDSAAFTICPTCSEFFCAACYEAPDQHECAVGDDQFVCEGTCGRTLDIEDSVRVGPSLYCEPCGRDARLASHRMQMLTDRKNSRRFGGPRGNLGLNR
jgi:hypothetical protein